MARNLNDKPAEATAAYWYGMGLSLNCEFEKAAYHLQKTLSFNSAIYHLPRMSALKGLLGYVGYFYQGKIHKAYEASNEGLGMAELSGDAWSKALNYCCHGVSCYGKGFLQEAIDHLSRGYDLAEKIDQRYCKPAARYFLGEIYFDLGEYEKAEDHLRNAIRHWEEYKYFPSFLRASKLALARALAIKTRGDEDLSVLPDDGSLYKAKQFDGIMKKYRAELLLYLGNKNISDAEAWIKRAIEADKTNGMKWHLGKDFVFYFKVLKSKGNLSEAKDTLGLAVDLFKECGAEGWVVKYRKELRLLQ